MRLMNKICLLILLMFGFIQCQKSKTDHAKESLTDQEVLNESDQDFDNRMEWWRDAKFGMFIHWGAYAVPAGVYKGKAIDGTGEWIMNNAPIPVSEYEKYAKQFNPVKYNPDRWVKIAKDAGVKYIIITSKHHEGFGLWDSKASDYDAVDYAAVHKDLLAPLKKACDKYGIKLGFYYSIMDWHHPDAQAPHYPTYNTDKKKNPKFDQYVENYMKPQLEELVKNYDPAVLWFDGEWIPEWTHKDGVALYKWLRKMDPKLIINNRIDKGRNGMQGMNEGKKKYVGDFGTPEQEILKNTSDFDWESCMTMNDTWGYRKDDKNWKSARQLIFNLADVAAKGGNYLLNVGPTAKGEIPHKSIERLRKMGVWLNVNGEAIYNTEKLHSNFKQGKNIRYTKKKENPVYYGILFAAPGEAITFKYLKPEEGSEVQLLGYETPLKWTFDEETGLTIEIPAEIKNDPKYEPAMVFKIRGNEVS